MGIIKIIFTILFAHIILSLLVYYGYRAILNSRHFVKNFNKLNSDNNTQVVSLDLRVVDSPYTHHGITINVSKMKLDSVPDYTKYTFTTQHRPTVNKLYADNHPIDLNNAVFESAIMYNWFESPILTIVNVITKENHIEIRKPFYFKSIGGMIDPFVPYQINEDIQNNPSEVLKLLNKINSGLFNVISIDIANYITAEKNDPIYLNETKTLNISKEIYTFSPFVKISTKINRGGIYDYFQILELKNKDENLKIDLPHFRIMTFSVYMWNKRPLLLNLETELCHFYFTVNENNEWIRFINDDGIEPKSYIYDRELHQQLGPINFRLNDAVFIDVSMTENYSYLGTDILVVKEGIFSGDNYRYNLYTHKLKNETFKLGACMQRSLFLKDIPIGIDIYSLSVYQNHLMPYLIKLVISENGNKKDKFYRLEKDSRWRPVTKLNIKDDIKLTLNEIFESLGPIIELDIGKKHNYQCLQGVTSSKCDYISVTFHSKYGPYSIYVHKPILSRDKSNIDHGIFSFNRVLYKEKVMNGIFPGVLGRARIYMLDDEIPVGIELFTYNSTVNYINTGDNFWDLYQGYFGGSKYMLSPHKFISHTKEHNLLVSLDLGSKSCHTNRETELSFTKQTAGKYVRLGFVPKIYSTFKFKGIYFKQFEYDFDSESLFLKSFTEARIYYNIFSNIPLGFELISSKETLLYYNNVHGKWLKDSNFNGDAIPILNVVSDMAKGMIIIDNFGNYSSGKGIVSVVEHKVSDRFVKYTHKYTDIKDINGIIYKGYAISGLPYINHSDSISVYFKKDSHLALLIQINSKPSTKNYANRGNDTWSSVDEPQDITGFLHSVEEDINQY